MLLFAESSTPSYCGSNKQTCVILQEGDVQSAFKLLPKEEKKEVETIHAGTKAPNSTVASCDVGFVSILCASSFLCALGS